MISMAENTSALKELLVQILEEANDEGHNAETDYDREFFADFLIEKGIIVCHADLSNKMFTV